MEPTVCIRLLLKGNRGQDLWSLACARGRGTALEKVQPSECSASSLQLGATDAYLKKSGGGFSWEVSIQGTVLQWHPIETCSLQLPQPRALQVSRHGWTGYRAHASLLIFKLIQFLPSRLGVGYKSGGGWGTYVAIRGIQIWTRRNREMHSRCASWESGGPGSTNDQLLALVVRAS